MPLVPLELVALVMTGAVGRMVSDRALECVPAEFEAEIVTVAEPAVVGMPEIIPLVALMARPLGRAAAP